MNRRSFLSSVAAAPAGLVPVVAVASPAVVAPRPEPVWVTVTQGGYYISWEEWKSMRKTSETDRLHAVGYADGWIWDATIGWRREMSKFQPYMLLSRAERVARGSPI
jgi:hypothetical protein